MEPPIFISTRSTLEGHSATPTREAGHVQPQRHGADPGDAGEMKWPAEKGQDVKHRIRTVTDTNIAWDDTNHIRQFNDSNHTTVDGCEIRITS